MTNSPLDFQQNPVEFVKDALRVARGANKGPWTRIPDLCEIGVEQGETVLVDPEMRDEDAAHIAKFDPPTVIALMEDWLRLRERVHHLREEVIGIGNFLAFDYPEDAKRHVGEAIENDDRAALAKQG